MSRPAAWWLATWAGVGCFPVAPGAVGSAVAAALAWALLRVSELPAATLAILAALLLAPAVWAAGQAERIFGREDPQQVVVDEVVGQWLALAAVRPDSPFDWVAGFLLFRLFDVWKPTPIRRFEALPGGWGVVADDAAAGVCAMMSLAFSRWLNLWA